jgi:hypothetical protein
MLIVFASEHDENAKWLVRRWESRGAALMVPPDLSRAGWRCTSRDAGHSQCVLGGSSYSASAIEGVLLRWPAVLPAELPHIAESDRNYVAAEMNAFLVYWFTAIGRRVVNRPTPRSLCGPGWYPEHWTHHAARVGLRVAPVRHTVKPGVAEPLSWPEYDGPAVKVTVAGPGVYGSASRALAAKARALAEAAGTSLVQFRFDGAGAGARFLDADLCPRLDDERVERAVADYLETGDWPAGDAA